MISGLNINAGSVSLKASVEKYEELTGIFEKYLARKGQRFCFHDLSHCSFESGSAFRVKGGGNGTLGVSTYLTEQGSNREHDGRS